MKSLKNSLACTPLRGTLAMALLGLLVPVAQAQNFESYYGEQLARDSGEDVKSVRYCPNKGSIIVGTRRIPNGLEALATRVDDNGVALWQRAYRVAGGISTTANAVVELSDGSGFALTGSAVRTDQLMYVMRIRCDGQVVWANLLGNQSAGNRGTGYDIIEARNPLSPTAPAELVAVGDENLVTPAGVTHGRIARLNLGGGVLWNRAYNQPNQFAGLRFRALTENRSAVATQPDLVIAGSAARTTNWTSDRRALMFRVRFNGAPVCNAVLGNTDPANEDYFGITALSQGNFVGESVLVGAFAPATTANTMAYLTRFNAGGCIPQVQSVWRDLQNGVTTYDVVESPATTVGLPPSIVAVGTVRGTVTAGDGIALTANDGSLGPQGAQWRYSTQSSRMENLLAIDNKSNRFLMSGSTFSDWDATGDAQDFYLVQTDPNKRTQCAVPWQFSWNAVQLPYQQFTPPIVLIQANTLIDVGVTITKDEGYCCQLNPG